MSLGTGVIKEAWHNQSLNQTGKMMRQMIDEFF